MWIKIKIRHFIISSFHHPYFIHNMGCCVGIFFLRFSFPFNCIFKKQSMYVAVIVVIEFFSRFSISILLLKSAFSLVENIVQKFEWLLLLIGWVRGFIFIFSCVCWGFGGFEGEIERRKKGGESHFYKIFTLIFFRSKKN